MLRWGAAALLLFGFLWISAFNWRVFFQSFVRRERAPSWIPLLGGVLGTLAALVAPAPRSAHLWWLPLVLDWGCLPGLAHTLLFHARRRLRARTATRR